VIVQTTKKDHEETMLAVRAHCWKEFSPWRDTISGDRMAEEPEWLAI
jgi:hypothetical protein